MFRSLFGAVAAIFLLVSAAKATPVESISFGGNLGYGYDSTGLFGAAKAQLGGDSYSITFSFNPTAMATDSCGTGGNNSCYWTFGAGVASETLTVNGVSMTLDATSGNIQYCACGSDSIGINAYGPNGLYFGGYLQDSDKLFANQGNVNNLVTSFTDVALSSGNWGTSGIGPDYNTSFGSNPSVLSASYSPGSSAAPLPTPAVPEPMTLALFGAGLAGVGALRRRGRTA